MITVTYGKPAQGMTLPAIRPASPFNRTRRANRVLAQADMLIAYFQRVKGHKPELIHLTPAQFTILGVSPGQRRNGVRLEVAR